MNLNTLIAALDEYRDHIGKIPQMNFEIEQKRWGVPFHECFRKEIPAEGLSDKSGVYFLLDENDNVLYIGKATTGNFGREIYGKFSTATAHSDNDAPFFGKSSMAKYAPPEYVDMLRNGKVHIVAVRIDPPEMSSVVEVFLQTYSFRNHKLPPLNKRIG